MATKSYVDQRISQLEEQLGNRLLRLDDDITEVRERVEQINRILMFKYKHHNGKEPTFSNLLQKINNEYSKELPRFRRTLKNHYPKLSNEEIRTEAYKLLQAQQNEFGGNESLPTIINSVKYALKHKTQKELPLLPPSPSSTSLSSLNSESNSAPVVPATAPAIPDTVVPATSTPYNTPKSYIEHVRKQMNNQRERVAKQREEAIKAAKAAQAAQIEKNAYAAVAAHKAREERQKEDERLAAEQGISLRNFQNARYRKQLANRQARQKANKEKALAEQMAIVEAAEARKSATKGGSKHRSKTRRQGKKKSTH